MGYIPHLPGYRIKGEISRSGCSVVYLADDLVLARRVAVKLPHPSAGADHRVRDRFLRECRLVASLTHPNLLAVYAAGQLDGRPYAVMPYVAGGTLGAMLASHGRLSPQQTASLVVQLAAGLDHLHARGVVHRDVKPGNILAGRPHWYLADFGVATAEHGRPAGRSGDPDQPATGPGVGSIGYGAPEQLAGRPVDRRADVYALGAVVLSCLTGRLLSGAAGTRSDMPAALAGVPERVPAGAARAVASAMAPRPGHRYPSCGEFAAAFNAALPGAGSGLDPPSGL